MQSLDLLKKGYDLKISNNSFAVADFYKIY